ncbi:MAG: sugar ABC transporter substrate-binding protein [Alphaproteobacteria bacterium]|nr:sugar ABC transporter substrate-binding protein [Alphaproteobacteria bacterium]
MYNFLKRFLLSSIFVLASFSLIKTVHAIDPDQALAELQKTTLSTGPQGESPVSASEINLSDDEIAKIKAMNATAVIPMHIMSGDWSQAQINGLKYQFEKMGVEVLAVTDAGFKAEKQVSDIETLLAKNPDILISIPTDPTATAPAYKKAAEQGVVLVFMDNVPHGFVAGKDYISAVSADNMGNGVASAHLMAKALNQKGEIGIVFHAADFFVTAQRYEGFKKTIVENYPDIKIVAEQGIGGPDFPGDAEKAASAMIVSNSNLDGIWAVWDQPAEGVMEAARANGRDDLIITTIDLGENVAIAIAKGGPVYGLGAQRPFDQGVTEAKLAGYGLLGKEAPPYVALPALPVEKDNILDAWKSVYYQDAPESIVKSLK